MRLFRIRHTRGHQLGDCIARRLILGNGWLCDSPENCTVWSRGNDMPLLSVGCHEVDRTVSSNISGQCTGLHYLRPIELHLELSFHLARFQTPKRLAPRGYMVRLLRHCGWSGIHKCRCFRRYSHPPTVSGGAYCDPCDNNQHMLHIYFEPLSRISIGKA